MNDNEQTLHPGLLTKRELAERLRLTPRTVENMMAAGLPYYRLGSRRSRFDWSQVKEYLDENCRTVRSS